MLRSLSQFFYAQSTGTRVILSFLLMMLFNIFIFPFMQGRMGTFVSPMDMRFGFTENDVLSFFTLLGAEGRSVYLFVESVVDILYPLVYTGFSMLVLSFFYRSLLPENTLWRLINVVLPLVVMISDFAENAGIMLMLYGFPSTIATHVGWTSIANECKWVAFVFLIGSVIVGGILWLVKGRRS